MQNHLFRIHHKIKLQLDAICQEAGDMDVEEFMEVYKSLKPNTKTITSINRNFQENALDAMDYGQDESDIY
jgi:hypothetical protein